MNEWGRLAADGRHMSAAEAARLEAKLATTPDDVSARVRLLGYFFFPQPDAKRGR